MSRYLIDTSVLIDFSKNRQPTVARILAMLDAGDELAVCDITVAEFYAGQPAGSPGDMGDFIAQLPYWPTTFEAAVRAGEERHHHSRQGRTLATTDALIAAVALARGAGVLTENPKDFPMPELALVSLR